VIFDTSALVKYFHVEEGTEQVTNLINNSNYVILFNLMVLMLLIHVTVVFNILKRIQL